MNFQCQPYPKEIEQWWIRQACGDGAEVAADSCLSRYGPIVDRLSGLFTTEREVSFGDYGKDRELLLAYGLFFYPQTFTRIQFPLLEVLRRAAWRPQSEPLRILDLGTGSGAALTGAVELLRAAGQGAIEAQGVDLSERALLLARTLAHDHAQRWPGVKWTFRQGDLARPAAWPAGRWDLILASFALNEAFHGRPQTAAEQWLAEALTHLGEHGVLLLVEPALKETSERLEALRDWVVASTAWRVLAPCVHAFGCPLRAGGEYWCHEVREWDSPDSVAFLNRRLFRGISQVKFSFLAMGSHARPLAVPKFTGVETFRLISPVYEQKGRLVAAGCAADGLRHTYEWPTRGLKKSEVKALTGLERGTILGVDNIAEKGGVLRIHGETTVHNFER